MARDNATAADCIVTGILDQAEGLTTHPHIGRAGRVPRVHGN